jgi:hypothetical protein
MVRILSNVGAEKIGRADGFDGERIVDSGLGWLISMEN